MDRPFGTALITLFCTYRNCRFAMLGPLLQKNYSPIGIDISTRGIKLLQYTHKSRKALNAIQWDFEHPITSPATSQLAATVNTSEQHTSEALTNKEQKGLLRNPNEKIIPDELSDVLKKAYCSKKFRGKEGVLTLSAPNMYLQNIRVPKVEGDQFERLLQQEAAAKIPFPLPESEIRYLNVAEVRQGGGIMKELILMACYRPHLEEYIHAIERAGLTLIGFEPEATSLIRSYNEQFKRDEDKEERSMLVHIGYSNTLVIIAQGEDILLMKYLPVDGAQMTKKVAELLQVTEEDAQQIRRQVTADRRKADLSCQLTQTIQEALRPTLENLAAEISRYIRYHSVTFRGKPLVRLILSGSEANHSLVEELDKRVNLPCQLSEPFRGSSLPNNLRMNLGWEIAAGLAMYPKKSAL
ncbi:MAG: pilus assembly protein PilM [Pirellulaceae bacterium]|nr:pilus assembly protein PilM [Pirellulaceae bacterium]